jgi:hypothetical protein
VRPAPQQEDVEISPSSPAAAIAPVTTARAAEIMNVDRHTVSSARKVLSEGTAEEIRAVEQGAAAVSTLARETAMASDMKLRSGLYSSPGEDG